MDIVKSNIVKSTAGRDEGDLFFVLDIQEEFLLLADGKRRRVENPKRKKCKHVAFVGESHSVVAEKIRSSEKITNSELRKALAACIGGGNQDQEGL
ncbi:MAG: KOW domain-containing RNA-binding protein [Firmicutes bacterium]|nr:KOW domain-containing RNA-binding protein [Bacillota bacterium]